MASESLLSCISSFLRYSRNQWPWISLTGHSRSYMLASIESQCTTLYRPLTVTFALSLTVSQILPFLYAHNQFFYNPLLFRLKFGDVPFGLQCESKNPPEVFWHFFPNGWEFFCPNFAYLLYVPIYWTENTYYGGPTGTHQRSFERYHPQPPTASPSPRLGVRNPHSNLQSKISGKRVLIKE